MRLTLLTLVAQTAPKPAQQTTENAGRAANDAASQTEKILTEPEFDKKMPKKKG